MHCSPRSWVAPPLLAVLAMSCDASTPPDETDASSPTPDAGRLERSWPHGGPPRLWSRVLGAGYSGIVVEDDRLYTMYREGNHEVVICLDARSGDTIWESRYESTPIAEQGAALYNRLRRRHALPRCGNG